MLQTIYIGTLQGIRLYIHWTFWLIAIYIGLLNLGHGLASALAAIGFVFVVFGCVFLHEMGHAIAAKWFGFRTLDITMYPIGGVARIADFSGSPVAELVIALAGPFVNIVIAAGLFAVVSFREAFSTLSTGQLFETWGLEQLLIANLALAIFNMIPAFPMDGGRVLRAVLAMWMPFSRATDIAAKIGQVMAGIMFLLSIYYLQLTLFIIAVFVFLACSSERLRIRFANLAGRNPNSPYPDQGPFSPHNPWDEPPNDNSNSSDVVDAVDVRRVR